MGLLGLRLVCASLPIAVIGLAPGGSAAAEPVAAPGMVLADGRVIEAPTTAVWGSATPDDAHTRAAVRRLRAEAEHVWMTWDAARRSVSGILPSSIVAPGSVDSPTRAEAFALGFVARHLELLAPGATIDDFVVVANDRSSGIRTVGLAQRHGGVPVLGGQISVRFKGDRLVYAASQALPDVRVASRTAPTVPDGAARAAALAFVARDHGASPRTIEAVDGPFILPLWTGTAWEFREVVRVEVLGRTPLGRWSVYLEVESGEPVAREQSMRQAATVRFDVPVRRPDGDRYDAIAPLLNVTQGGAAAITDVDGEVALSTSPTTVDTSVLGTLVDIVNDGGSLATASFPVADGGTVLWSAASDEFGDAQLSGFVHAGLAKEYVRAIAPALTWLDGSLEVHVNVEGTCNAVSDGDQLYFLRAGDCQNTARLADVVYHETGHSVHRAAIIPGVGAQQSALSEGISDYLAATMVDDSGMGRGFVFTDDPLRELDPEGFEWMWPQDKGESHAEGRIIGGTLWDLRTALQAELGDAAGRAYADLLWYESIRRAVDIPTMYPEVLVADDDDGNLANGTPNVCEINAVFEAHGLRDPSQVSEASVDLVQVDGGRQVELLLALPVFDGCPLEAGEAELSWRLRGDPQGITTVPMVTEDGVWVATIPTQATGAVVEYQVTLTYSDGSVASFPRNAADPWYQTFFGAAQPIWCLDQQTDPADWSFAGAGNDWTFGPLMGGGIDPAGPYDDDGVQLSQELSYAPYSSTTATGPIVDISGHQDVRLHFRRWLTVEDGFFDQATLRANDQVLWSNLATEQANVHHVDREWRFVDLPLADFVDGGSVQLQFGLTSDGGLEFGGWSIDALCVIEVVESVCGDGIVTGDEQCDDANTDDGDGCDATCVAEPIDPSAGDTSGSEGGDAGTSDTGGDDGNATGVPGDEGGGTDGGSSTGAAQDGTTGTDGCGCSTDGRRGIGMLAVVVVLAGRRRRRAS